MQWWWIPAGLLGWLILGVLVWAVVGRYVTRRMQWREDLPPRSGRND